MPDRAVAAEHHRDLACGRGDPDALGGVAHDLDDLRHVLRPRVVAVGAPAPHLAIAVVVDVGAERAQPVEQAGVAKRGRRPLLARGKRTGARGDSEDAERPADTRTVPQAWATTSTIVASASTTPPTVNTVITLIGGGT